MRCPLPPTREGISPGLLNALLPIRILLMVIQSGDDSTKANAEPTIATGVLSALRSGLPVDSVNEVSLAIEAHWIASLAAEHGRVVHTPVVVCNGSQFFPA
jgi:hypothetical protein